MGISYHHARHAMEVKNNHDAIAYPIVNSTVDVPPFICYSINIDTKEKIEREGGYNINLSLNDSPKGISLIGVSVMIENIVEEIRVKFRH